MGHTPSRSHRASSTCTSGDPANLSQQLVPKRLVLLWDRLIDERQVDGMKTNGIGLNDHSKLIGGIWTVFIARQVGSDGVVCLLHAVGTIAAGRIPWEIGGGEEQVLLQAQVHFGTWRCVRGEQRGGREEGGDQLGWKIWQLNRPMKVTMICLMALLGGMGFLKVAFPSFQRPNESLQAYSTLSQIPHIVVPPVHRSDTVASVSWLPS